MSLITIFEAKEFEVTRLYLSPESYLRLQYTLPRHQNNIILITFNLLLSLFARRDPGMFSDNEI